MHLASPSCRSFAKVSQAALGWLLGSLMCVHAHGAQIAFSEDRVQLKSEVSLHVPGATTSSDLPSLLAPNTPTEPAYDPVVLRSSSTLTVERPVEDLKLLALGSIGALKSSRMLQEELPTRTGQTPVTFVLGEHAQGHLDLETVIHGDAELRRQGLMLRADRLEYYHPSDTAKGRGNVHINHRGNQFDGQQFELRVDAFEGSFDAPSYRFLKGGGYGQAQRMEFLDDQRSIAYGASYTTCERGDEESWSPDWIVTAERVKFDQEEDTGYATNGVLRFKGVPLLYAPQLSFPLSEKRRSGLLPPTTIVDKISGTQLTVPYYFDIAPNRDATLSPTWMSKRGFNLSNQLRYLEPSYNGQAQIDVMPSDTLRDHKRWAYSYLHNGELRSPSNGGNMNLSLNLNRVSDADYWRDFPRANSTLTQRLLPSDAALSWSQGQWSASARMLKYQTLQDVNAPIDPSYDLRPRLSLNYQNPSSATGVNWSLGTSYSNFLSDAALKQQPNGQRIVTQGQISYPWINAPGGFITPKLQLHATRYQFDTPLVNAERSATRVVPTFSLDSGLLFERDTQLFGRNFTQTLEPRAFYVRTPFRDQSLLPNYDSGANDFNFSSVFNENAYAGDDRISDSDLLTLGVTSRLLKADDGAEVLRFGLAQRLRFSNQNVTLPGGTPITDRVSDLLLGATANLTSKWSVDSFTQYNPKTARSERTTLSTRYSPGRYRTVSAAYRYQREASEQFDVGWQWPLNDLWGDKGRDLGPGRGLGGKRWYSVGRLNYSAIDKKLVDAVVGFEYDSCCWIGRVVLDRTQLSNSQANVRLLFQIEFVGFSRLGPSPLPLLKSNIPRYELLRSDTAAPSRFTQYD